MPNLIQDIVRHRILNKQRNLTVSNTLTETDLWTYTVPPDTLLQTNVLHVRIIGYFFNNTAQTFETVNLKIYFGSTLLFHDAFDVLAKHATRRFPLDIDFVLAADNAATVQVTQGRILLGTIRTAPAVGYGFPFDLLEQYCYAPFNGIVSTEDSTLSQILKVSVILQHADVNLQAVVKYAYVELIRY